MAGNIRERLLHDAVDRNLHAGGQAGLETVETDLDPNRRSFGETPGIGGDRFRQAEIVEHRGMQQLRQVPHAVQRVVRDGSRLFERFPDQRV